MATIGNMVVNVLARTTGFSRGMTSARKNLTLYQQSVLSAHRHTQRFHKVLGLVGVSLGAGRIVSGLKETAAEIDNLAKTSQKLGIATENLAGLQHAGQLTGVETRTLNMALQRMVRRVSEAAVDLGEARGALQELRLEAKQLNQLSPDQMFLRIAEAIRGVENQSDRVRLSFKLFDSEGVALVQTLQHGAGAIRNWMNEAKQLGTAITGEEAAKIEKLNDALIRLGASTKGLKTQILIDISPQATRAVDALSETVVGLKLTKDPTLKKLGQGLTGILNLGPVRENIETIIRERTESLIRGQIRQGVVAGSPHQVGGTSAEHFRMPRRGLFGNEPFQTDADIRSRQIMSQQVMGWLRGQTTERLQAAGQKILTWAQKLPEQVEQLQDAGKKWALADLADSLLGRGGGTREFFRQQELQRQELAKRETQKNESMLGRRFNEALEKGTQGFYREALANMTGLPLQKQELAEAKKQTKQLVQLVAFARQAPDIQMVAIPQ